MPKANKMTPTNSTQPREQAEKALLESEERFRTVADFTYDWEYWIAPDGHCLYVSPSCERITGYSPEEFVDDPELLQRIVHSDDQPMVAEHFLHESSEEQASFDFRIITKSGQQRWIGHCCQPVYSQDGRHLGRRASNRDITDRKLAEEALSKSRSFLQTVGASRLRKSL